MLLCKQLGLLGGDEVAVDGSFFKGDTNTCHIYTEAKLDQHLAALEQKIDAYQQQLGQQDGLDDQAGLGSLIEDNKLAEKIARLEEQQAQKKALLNRLKGTEDQQISLVDPDARLLQAVKLIC